MKQQYSWRSGEIEVLEKQVAEDALPAEPGVAPSAGRAKPRERFRWIGRLRNSPRLQFALASVTDQVLISGSNLVLNVVLARWLSKTAYGWFGVILSAFVLFSGFFTACLIEPLSVFGPVRFRHCLQSYTRRVIELHGLLCLVLAPAVTVFLYWTAPPGVSVWRSAMGVNLCLTSVLLYWLLRRVAYVTSEYGAAVAAGALYNLFLLGAIAAMHWLGWLSAPAGLCSQAAGAACAALLLHRTLTRRAPEAPSDIPLKDVAAQHWEYGRWALGTAMVYWLSAEAYYVIVGRLVSAPAVAGFRSVQNFSMLFPNFATAMSVLLLPKLAARFAAGGGAAIHRLVSIFTAACAIAATGYGGCLWLLGSPLLSALYGKDYVEYAYLFPVLFCNLVLIAASQGVQVGLRAMNAPREVFSGFLIAGLFTCTAGVAMTYVWQLTGAVVGLCCSTLLFLCYVLFRYHSLVRRLR
jgi:O-antigen/teichoic acid export membrane protein